MAAQGELERQVFRWFGRYGTALVWEDVEPAWPHAGGGVVCCALLTSWRDRWVLFAAGDVVEGIRRRRAAGQVFRAARMVGGWAQGRAGCDEIWFPEIADPRRTPQGWIRSRAVGLDLAWFALPQEYCDLVGAGGMAPMSEVEWCGAPEALDGYLLFGFVNDPGWERALEREHRRIEPRPRLVPLAPGAEPAGLQSVFPRLFYQAVSDGHGPAPSPEGMCGGPVLGYRLEGGSPRLWLAGIHGGQLRGTGVVTVCPMDRFATALSAAVEATGH